MDSIIMIEQLKTVGIRFGEGITDEEIQMVEDIYDIKFPISLRSFCKLGLPLSENDNGFCKWTDFSNANIMKIKERIQAPLDWLLIDVKHGFWLPKWGKRAKSIDEVIERFVEMSTKAPRLIPVYSHRYIPQLDGADDPPVISTVGRDTIFYGSNLQEYLYNEFLCKEYSTNRGYMSIPFWSDIIENKRCLC